MYLLGYVGYSIYDNGSPLFSDGCSNTQNDVFFKDLFVLANCSQSMTLIG